MAKDLWYVRHGMTVFNDEGIWQGRADSPLTSLGHAQARATGEHIRAEGLAFDHVFRSPAGRVAQTTADLLPGRTDVEVASGLNEMSFGSLDGTPNDGRLGPYGDLFVQYGGESEDQVTERVMRTLRAIMDRPDCQSVLVVSHGTVARLLCAQCVQRPGDPQTPRFVPNCALLHLSYDEATRDFSFLGMWAPDVEGNHDEAWHWDGE